MCSERPSSLSARRHVPTALAAVLAVAGLCAYLVQWNQGLTVTGLSRQMSWGLYIGSFTFLVGVAASAIAPTLIALHGRAFPRLILYGEALAVTAVLTAILCVLVDLGRPEQMLNLLLHPRPSSPMFWDLLALTLYLAINLILLRHGLQAYRQDLPLPAWHRRLTCAAVPLAFSIHTVTAFLYAGLPGRPYWLSALLAARFLASALCSGPALLLLGLGCAKAPQNPEAREAASRALLPWIAWALALHGFFFGLELFTAGYSGIPDAWRPLELLWNGPSGWWCALSWLMAGLALLLILLRARGRLLACALCLTLIAIWLDKAPALMRGGFNPDPFGAYVPYTPTATELFVLLGIFSTGWLILTFLRASIARNCGNSFKTFPPKDLP